MIKKISLPLAALIFLFSLLPIESVKYETTSLKLGTELVDITTGSETKFYTVTLDSGLEDNDLMIDAKIRNNKNGFNESPLVLISTVSLIF